MKIGDKVEVSFTARIVGINEEITAGESRRILYKLEVRDPTQNQFLNFLNVTEEMIVRLEPLT